MQQKETINTKRDWERTKVFKNHERKKQIVCRDPIVALRCIDEMSQPFRRNHRVDENFLTLSVLNSHFWMMATTSLNDEETFTTVTSVSSVTTVTAATTVTSVTMVTFKKY